MERASGLRIAVDEGRGIYFFPVLLLFGGKV